MHICINNLQNDQHYTYYPFNIALFDVDINELGIKLEYDSKLKQIGIVIKHNNLNYII